MRLCRCVDVATVYSSSSSSMRSTSMAGVHGLGCGHAGYSGGMCCGRKHHISFPHGLRRRVRWQWWRRWQHCGVLRHPCGLLHRLGLLDGEGDGCVLVIAHCHGHILLHRHLCSRRHVLFVLLIVGGRGEVALVLGRLEVAQLHGCPSRLVLPGKEDPPEISVVVRGSRAMRRRISASSASPLVDAGGTDTLLRLRCHCAGTSAPPPTTVGTPAQRHRGGCALVDGAIGDTPPQQCLVAQQICRAWRWRKIAVARR
jgi:hypothetical protein